jgi:hypothetical protein
MPTRISALLAAACAPLAALALLFIAPAAAIGGTVPASLRVIGARNEVLAEMTLATTTTSIRTSPRATCFGKGTGGSGKTVTLPGATAMGLLISAARSDRALRPVLVSDHFGFGLALCGVGHSAAGFKGPSWYLKVNHKSPSKGGSKVRLFPGDQVLWDLARSYPYPSELSLSAPAEAEAGVPFEVSVSSYDEEGTRTPASGVTVTGAAEPTDANGRATVTLTKPALLIARSGADIPSNREPVCVAGGCPSWLAG